VQSLVRAAIYGAGAALAGCALYAVVAIVTGFEIGLIAIVVGIMVGKAIRHASNGLGGRPQQILAVALTYFAITTSYIPVYVYKLAQQPRPAAQASQTSNQATPSSAAEPLEPAPRSVSLGTALFYIFLLALAAPFLSLTSGVSALISLAIIFFGLSQAWRLTGRTDILVLGPYDVSTLERPEG
jgi:hypothetical protein